MASTLESRRTNVGSMGCLIDNGWHVGLVGLRALDLHRNNHWQLRWLYEQNDIEPTLFVKVDVGPTILPTKCQRRSNE